MKSNILKMADGIGKNRAGPHFGEKFSKVPFAIAEAPPHSHEALRERSVML
jgi:hypothetical protein